MVPYSSGCDYVIGIISSVLTGAMVVVGMPTLQPVEYMRNPGFLLGSSVFGGLTGLAVICTMYLSMVGGDGNSCHMSVGLGHGKVPIWLG